ncbi:hypothetical protein LWI28_005110 [Acer negundo]|uniref:Uncharacterized protein n=1 Tax=Acer negundo TaxID=4023 RepID=A0AAD5I9I1_ACENE|nr:hypothetical protein LWI28_005110 [Acer negundo]
MTSTPADGTTKTLACRFCTVSLTVTRRPFRFLADLQISDPNPITQPPLSSITYLRFHPTPTEGAATPSEASGRRSIGRDEIEKEREMRSIWVWIWLLQEAMKLFDVWIWWWFGVDVSGVWVDEGEAKMKVSGKKMKRKFLII